MRILDDEQRRLGARQRRGVDQRGQPAPPRIRVDRGQRHIGVGDAQQIIQQQQILRVGIRKLFPELRAGGFAVQVGHAHAGPQQPRHRMERDLVGVGFAEGPKHVHPATGCGRRGLAGRPALADTRRSHHIHHTTAATDRAVHNGVDRGHLRPATDQGRLGAPDLAIARADRHQLARAHRFVGPLDAHPLRFTQHHGVLDQPRGRLRQHHPARRGHRFHPLRHTDLLPDRGVTERPRTDLTGDHPTGVKSHPHVEIHTVALSDFDGKPLRLLLNAHGRQAGTNGVILQRHRGAEHRHHPVAGELHAPAVAAHHRRPALHQLGHDLAQPLHIQRRRDVHRAHHIGEQHRHLLVLRRSSGRCKSRTALATELGRRAGLRATGTTDQRRRGQSTDTIPAGVHVSIVSPLVNDVRHIAVPSPTRRFETLICRLFRGTGIALRPNRRHGIASAPF